MGEKIHVQLRKGKTIVFPYGATIEKNKSEVVVKDSKGNEIGCFERSELAGYWKEDIPLKMEDLTDEILDELIAQGKEVGKRQPDDQPDGVAGTPTP